MKILIAEDEERSGMVFQMILAHYGHVVTLTNDGEECVKAYRDALTKLPDNSEGYLAQHPPFDAVVMDSRMPKMDGPEAARTILELNKYQRIIFLSAYVLSTVQDVVRDLPAPVEVLQKPIDLEKLVTIIEQRAAHM
jgi:CheY-like chemotaxis protein